MLVYSWFIINIILALKLELNEIMAGLLTHDIKNLTVLARCEKAFHRFKFSFCFGDQTTSAIVRVVWESACIKCLSPDDKYAFFMYLISPRRYWRKTNEKDTNSSCWLSLSKKEKYRRWGRRRSLSNLFAYLCKQQFSIFLSSSKRKLTRVCRRCSTANTMNFFLLQSRRLSLQSLNDVISSPSTVFS